MKHFDTLRSIEVVGRSGSIRQAAEQLGVLPSGLTRKIKAFEQELGSPVFERLPHGMRLNAAGELLVQFIRNQAADFEQLRSAIGELSGLRRGHISLVCSQAFVDRVLPEEISRYRAGAPGITFDVKVRDHGLGVAALAAFEADLAVLVSSSPAPDMQVLLSGRQPLCAVMHRDHPAATDKGPIRLRDCLAYPVAMPDASLAVRSLLDQALTGLQHPMDVRLESGSLDLLRNYVLWERVLSFQLSTGIPPAVPDLHAVAIDERDIPHVPVVLGQLRGRALPIAVSLFVQQFSHHPLWNG